jgi:hypothetical protein
VAGPREHGFDRLLGRSKLAVCIGGNRQVLSFRWRGPLLRNSKADGTFAEQLADQPQHLGKRISRGRVISHEADQRVAPTPEALMQPDGASDERTAKLPGIRHGRAYSGGAPVVLVPCLI